MKTAGSPCENCNELFPAEYTMKDRPPQWKCLKCGAGGLLAGALAAPEPKPAQTKKHWREKGTPP